MKDIRDGIFDTLYQVFCEDDRAVLITADTGAFGIKKIKSKFKNRVIDSGVAEQGSILFAAGLAMAGKKPFVYSIIPFITLRCLEIIKVNVVHMNLPVTILGLGSGLSFSYDGPTHHATCDIGAMLAIGGIDIWNPCNADQAQEAVLRCFSSSSPSYIRIDKGVYPPVEETALESPDAIIVTTGVMYYTAKAVAKMFFPEKDVQVLGVNHINSLKKDLFSEDPPPVFVLEESSYFGGIMGAVIQILPNSFVTHIGTPEYVFEYGSREYLHQKLGLDSNSVYQKIKRDI